MARVRFQNGPDAPEIFLEEEIDEGTKADDAKRRLEELAHNYGTVEEAVAWFDGDKKPKHLGAEQPDATPRTSVLNEHVVTAPPSPEVQAKEADRIAKAEAENEKARDEAAAAHAEATKTEAAKK